MSLVELALKKMQAAAQSGKAERPRVALPPASPLPAGVIGEIVQRGSSHKRLEAGDEQTEAPARIIRIDENALRAERLMPPAHQVRALADQYRNIKRPLLGGATGRGAPKLDRGQVIMMASAMSGEGKTFTAINLAMSMAMEKDMSVLLVDADVAKPHISRTFGVDREPGLLDVLRDEAMNVESVILPTSVSNLSLLPAGHQTDTANELLASQRMEATINYLAESNRSRIVLIDSSPLLLTSESRALAHSAGQIVIVVRADVTPQQAVLDAIGHLGEGKSISLILNQSKMASPGYYYGYGDSEKKDENASA